MISDQALFVGIVFLSCFVQASVGFGLPMIAMPLVVQLFGIHQAAPLVAIIVFQLQIIMVARYRHSMNQRTVWHISAAAIAGIPLGIYLLVLVPEAITVTLLGLLLIIYVIYSGFRFPLPALTRPQWAYLFGLFGGLGAGAYNIGAPPVIIYGDMQKWPPEEFKSNLQAYFLVITVVTMLTHTINGNMSGGILRQSGLAFPFVLLGAVSGFYLDRFINPAIFRRLVLGLLLILGINLALSWIG